MRVDVDGDAGVGESGRADGAAAASAGRAAERQTRSSRALSDAGDGGAAASFDGVILLLARRAGSRSGVRAQRRAPPTSYCRRRWPAEVGVLKPTRVAVAASVARSS